MWVRYDGVLDQSGSMGGIEGATCEGINSFFAEQRALKGKALLSMTLFDTSFDVRFVGHDLAEVPDLGTDGNRFNPHGGTSLYDAVATTLVGTQSWLDNHPEFTGRVVCIINTDGGENSSVTYHRHQGGLDRLNTLITEKTKAGWEFVFMGAGQAAWTEGQNFTSIPMSNIRNYDDNAGDVLASYAGTSASLASSRASGGAFTGQ